MNSACKLNSHLARGNWQRPARPGRLRVGSQVQIWALPAPQYLNRTIGSASSGSQLQQELQITRKDNGDRQVSALSRNTCQEMGGQWCLQGSDRAQRLLGRPNQWGRTKVKPRYQTADQSLDQQSLWLDTGTPTMLPSVEERHKLSWNGSPGPMDERSVCGVPRGDWSGSFRLVVHWLPTYHWEKLTFKLCWKSLATWEP